MSSQTPAYAFDVQAYRAKNQDLRALSDEALAAHFEAHGFAEPRLYAVARTTVERFSMKYLRGRGLEIGSGEDPVPLFGQATCVYADIAPETVFDAEAGVPTDKILFDINGSGSLSETFDFVIASHVLEHVDSLYRGLARLSACLRPGGLAYVVLPNCEHDADQAWMPRFGLLHHVIEAVWPAVFRVRHERDFCRGMERAGQVEGWGTVQQRFPSELREDIRRGRVTPAFRYIYHRHSYGFEDWLGTLLVLGRLVSPRLRLVDAAMGDERSDCHFLFRSG